MNSVYQKLMGKKRAGGLMERTVALLTMTAIIVGVAFAMAGEPVYAVSPGDLKVTYAGDMWAMQGDSGVNVSFDILNTTSSDVTLTVKLKESSDFTIVRGKDGAMMTIGGGKTGSPSFEIDIARRAREEITLSLEIYADNGALVTTERGTITVSENSTPAISGKTASVDVAYTLSNSDGIIAGEENTLSLEIFNRGSTVIKNTQISLGLPEGMSINNAGAYVNAGYIAVGETHKCRFPITADETMLSKNYGITVKISGSDSSNDSVNLEQILYIPVKGTDEKLSAKDIEITNISIPQQVMAGDEFTLAFELANRGTGKLADTKVTVEVPEGLANKTKNVFVVTGLEAGSTQRCTVTLFSPKKVEKDDYKTIKITAEATTGTGEKSNSVSVSQYAGTMIKNLGGTEKTPQLMISSYTYGGSYVQAGDDFSLNLGLYNTSATQDLVNVKVTLTSEDGSFIPVKSSNSFYIDKVAAKGTEAHSVALSSKRDAEQKTTSLTVDMSYEDTEGNAFTSKDVISIPVMQETRLVVDDLVAPPELYAGMQSSLSVDFYNMGKTVLNNLRVNVAGDFDTPQSNMYFVGNMETGKSDSYDFAFIPRQSGIMAGTITFTYEDAAGNEQNYEKPFEVTIMEDIPFEDPGMMEPPEDGNKFPWKLAAAGGAAAVAVAAVIIWKKHRKKKLDQEMEIDE